MSTFPDPGDNNEEMTVTNSVVMTMVMTNDRIEDHGRILIMYELLCTSVRTAVFVGATAVPAGDFIGCLWCERRTKVMEVPNASVGFAEV